MYTNCFPNLSRTFVAIFVPVNASVLCVCRVSWMMVVIGNHLLECVVGFVAAGV